MAAVDERAIAEHAWLATPDTFGRHLAKGSMSSPPHIRLIGWLLYLQAIGYLKRLTIALPPGHAKSTVTSRWFPAWNLERRPSDRIMLASYEATLAEEHGKEVRALLRDNQDQLSVRLADGTQAANRWQTTRSGGMWTSSAQGSITGRRASGFVEDDPFKGWEDSHSPTIRQRVWNNWRSVARTRLFPGGWMLAVQTRWHPEDLIGHLHEVPGYVHLGLPALAECDETLADILGPEFVERCRKDQIWLPDWHRAAGEPLWPWLIEPCAQVPDGVPWFSIEEMTEIRMEVGDLIFAGLYQQHPALLEGDMFKRHLWQKVDAAPADLLLVRCWDKAATQGGGDWTAGVLMGWSKVDKRIYILDVRRERLDSAGVEAFIKATAIEDRDRYGNRLTIRIEREGGSAGKDAERYYVTQVLPGFDVTFVPTTGSKEVEAGQLASQQQVGNVALVRRQTDHGPETPGWFEDFIEEASSFPSQGQHDDMIDAASKAFNHLLAMARLVGKARVAKQPARPLRPAGPSSRR